MTVDVDPQGGQRALGAHDALANGRGRLQESACDLLGGEAAHHGCGRSSATKRCVENLAREPALKAYHLLPTVRGDLLHRLGRFEEARSAFEAAAGLAGNASEQRLLRRRAEEAGAAAAAAVWHGAPPQHT